MKKLILLACVLLQCGGCAFTAQSVKITPVVKATSAVSGNGKALQLSVSDERPSKVIGQRGVGGVGADITIEGDLTSIILSAITSGLEKHGFSIANSQPSATISKLFIEIRNLSSKNIMGFWAGKLRDETGLKAICRGSKGTDYQKMFNGVFETSIQVVPTGDANNKYISDSVSDAINQLVNDDSLLHCLSE